MFSREGSSSERSTLDVGSLSMIVCKSVGVGGGEMSTLSLSSVI